MARVFVTGGAGYIGAVLVPMLLEKGHHVSLYDNYMYGAQSLFSFCGHPQLSLIKGDVRDEKTLGQQIKGHEWIIHLAAIVGYPACAADPLRANSVNVDGTRNVLKTMEKGQRLLFASTGSTYGKVEGTATEETPIAPLTLYGRNKRDSEVLIKESSHDYILLRFATVFGASPRMRLDLLINDFVYQAIHNRQIILYEGHFRRTFLHSYDAAAVYPFCMENFAKMKGGTFNVGDDAMNYTKKDITQRIRKYVEYYLHEAEVGHDQDQRDYAVDYTKLKNLGYRAKIDLDAGIQELVKIFTVYSTQDPLRNI